MDFNKLIAAIISGLIIWGYCIIAMIQGIFVTNHGWVGSSASVLMGLLLLVTWLIVTAVWVAFLLKDTYTSMSADEKRITDTIIKNVVREGMKELGHRKDKVGKTARFFSKVLSV